MKHRLKDAVESFVLYAFLILTTLLILYPIAFIVSSALSVNEGLVSMSLLPFADGISFSAYRRLFTSTPFFSWYRNTLKIACFNTVIALLTTTSCSYVLSRFRFRGKKPLMAAMLVLQMFPSFTGMMALYVIVWRLGLLDGHFGLILIYTAGQVPFNTWLIKGYLDSIPRSLDDAARVDGAGYFTTFLRIILPVGRPMILFVAVTSFTGPWMDFILPRLLLRSDKQKTLAVGLYEMISGRESSNFSMFSAGALLVAVPFMVLFILSQQSMVRIMASGAVKE